jgi:alkane 1-monooxygenase
MLWFTLATAVPVFLLALAGFLGGVWAIVAVLYLTAFVFIMDRLIEYAATDKATHEEFPASTALCIFLGFTHLILIVIAILALSGETGLNIWERLACFILFGQYFGQVSNANAHELIHRGSRWLNRLGIALYSSIFFGHHASAHTKVHHTWVGSLRDPNTARLGESVFRFWPRAWFGSFMAGLRAENAMRARAKTPSPKWTHPYVWYGIGTLTTLIVAFLLAGWAGIGALVAVSLYATLQHLASDYIQHYGLKRRKLANGKLEPVGAQHSWNSPQVFSSAMMLNVPRHSDHHLNPNRPYPNLRIEEDRMPILPKSLPVMGIIALWPPLWRHMMDERVAAVNGVTQP